MIIQAFVISLKMTMTSIAASSIIGILLGNVLCRRKSKWKGIAEFIILLPMFLPPTIIGYVLLRIISRYSPLGQVLMHYFGVNLIFTWQAGAVATFIIALPIIYQNSKGAFLAISKECEEAARVDGAGRAHTFLRIKLPMAARAVLCGILLGFARAFGEFGATIMVAGNIPGRTQNVPMAIYYAVDNGDRQTSDLLLAAVVFMGIIFIMGFNKLIQNSDY